MKSPYKKRGYSIHVFTDARFRGKGIGARLLLKAAKQVKQQGGRYLDLWTTPDLRSEVFFKRMKPLVQAIGLKHVRIH